MPAGIRRPLRVGLACLLLGIVLAGMLAGCAARRRGPARPVTGGETGAPPVPRDGVVWVRVGLAAAVAAVDVETQGGCRVLSSRRRTLGRVASGRITCRSEPRGVVWRGKGGGGRDPSLLILVPEDPELPLRWDGRAYPGEIWVLHGTGGLTVVDVVPLEEYLRGVVPWEIGRPGEGGLEALCAQAIAARTYTVSHLGEREALGFDLWADTRDQVFRGLDGTDPWTDLAVLRTRGQVLRHQGREIDAYYCSSCGGWCADVAAVWPRSASPYLVDHPDTDARGRDWCRGSPYHDWSATWSAGELNRLLARTLPEYLAWLDASPARRQWAGKAFLPAHPGADPRRPGEVLDVAVIDTTSSGRLGTVEFRMSNGTYRVRGDRIRWVLAPPGGETAILRSIRCRLDVERDATGRLRRLTAVGHGFGHGIGLCQSGALAMAAAGIDHRRILAHYYPGTTLERCDAVGPPSSSRPRH